MRAGPTLVVMAPGCTQPVKLATIASGNSFGATCWTDGKMDGPMWPTHHQLRKSPAEGVLFWVDDCEHIGQIDRYSADPVPVEWADLPHADVPSELDYLAALASGIANTHEQRRYLRRRFWWAGNDHLRGSTSRRLNGLHVHNLQALIRLLADENPFERWVKAEALRELACFDAALVLLDFEFPEGCLPIARRIRELALAGNATVAEVPPAH